MSNATQVPVQQDRNKLIRRKRLLVICPFSNASLYAKLFEGGPYYDETFPRPIYFPKSRTPFWREADVHDWIAASEHRSQLRTSSDRSLGVNESSMKTSTGAQTDLQKTATSIAAMENDASINMMTVVGMDGRKIQVPLAVRKKRTQLTHAPRAIPGSPSAQAPAMPTGVAPI